jgi:hypothetical protein
VAIEQGLTILSWFENLQEDERPPEYLWEDAEGLEQWWKRVEAKRNDGVETSRGVPDPAQSDQASKMVENDQARYLREAYS